MEPPLLGQVKVVSVVRSVLNSVTLVVNVVRVVVVREVVVLVVVREKLVLTMDVVDALTLDLVNVSVIVSVICVVLVVCVTLVNVFVEVRSSKKLMMELKTDVVVVVCVTVVTAGTVTVEGVFVPESTVTYAHAMNCREE